MAHLQPAVHERREDRTGEAPFSVGGFDRGLLRELAVDKRFEPFFGIGNKLAVPNTYGQMDEENFDLPDAYVGKNSYMTSIICTKVRKEDTWPTQLALPWVKHEGTKEIHWDEWTFNDTIATRTPEEAVSRLLSSHFNSYSANVIRFGLAFIMEHGFMTTEKGRTQYAMQIIQIRNAIVMSACYAVHLALLNPPVYIDDHAKYQPMQQGRDKYAIGRIFQAEVDQFAICQKNYDGLSILVGLLDARMQKRMGRESADMIVLPSGLQRMAQQHPAKRWFFLSGNKGAVSSVKEDMDVGDRLVVESMQIPMGEHQPSEDPCYRTVVVGSFIYMLAAHLQQHRMEDYKTSWLDIDIYSEDKDDWYRLSYAAAVKSMGLFSREGWHSALLPGGGMDITDLGKKVFMGMDNWGDVLMAAEIMDTVLMQINSKSDDVYQDFLGKFLVSRGDANAIRSGVILKGSASSGGGATFGSGPSGKKTKPVAPSGGVTNPSAPPDSSGAGGASDHSALAQQRIERSMADKAVLGVGDAIGAAIKKPFQAVWNRLPDNVKEGWKENAKDALDLAAKIALGPNLGDDVSTALLNSQLADLQENAVGHKTRLQIFYNWLKSLDQQSLPSGLLVPSDLHQQVSDFVKQHLPLVADGLTPEQKSAAAYQLAWNKAKDLLVLYDLEAATTAVNATPTPFEEYVMDRSTYRGYSGLSGTDEQKMGELELVSPFWRPDKDTLVTQVHLVAPEKGAGDGESTVKALPFATNAFTLASNFVVLFDVPEATVARMLANASSGKHFSTLFDIGFNWGKEIKHQKANLERAALLQFSVWMSTMYAILALVHKENEKADKKISRKEVTKKIATEWIKILKPVHILTQTKEAFLSVLPRAQKLSCMNYQASMDSLVIMLRDAAVMLLTAAGEAPLTVELLTTAVRQCEIKYTMIQEQAHVRSVTGMQADDRTLMGVADPLFQAQGATGSIGIFTHEMMKKQPTAEEQLERTQQVAAANRELQQTIEDVKKQRPAKKGADADEEAESDKEFLKTWQTTLLDLRVRLKDLTPDQFKHWIVKPIVSLAIQLKEWPPIDAKERADVNKAIVAALSKIAGVAGVAQGAEAMKASLSEAEDVAMPPDARITEWVFLWRQHAGAMKNYCSDLKDITSTKFFWKVRHLVFESRSLTKHNFEKLREAVLEKFASVVTPLFNTSYSSLFINKNYIQGIMQHLAGPEKDEDEEHSNDGTGKKGKRLPLSALRDLLMHDCPVSDGYFWKWCIQNDVLPPIGAIGFKPHIRYSAGTMIMLQKGGNTGKTFYGHANMLLSDNAATKMHYGHFTYYSKSMVMNSTRLIHGRNCYVRDYLGGNGHKLWDASDPNDKEEYKTGNLVADIFMVPVFMNHQVDSNHMDITGCFHADLGAGADANETTDYPSAQIYSEYWGWRNNKFSLNDNRFNQVRKPRDNTIVFQAHMGLFDPVSGRNNKIVLDQGHWGSRVYPGCGRVRRGLESYLRPVNYAGTAEMGFTT
jgi:hypothetical protein